MNCMKCGRELGEEGCFCDHCLEIMAKYPVKPGIAIQLPKKKDLPPLKKAMPRRRTLSPEEQIRVLKKRIGRLVIAWLVTLLLLAATLYPTVEYFLGKTFFKTGQNYSTITETEDTAP